MATSSIAANTKLTFRIENLRAIGWLLARRFYQSQNHLR
jgi:hypothetical protein